MINDLGIKHDRVCIIKYFEREVLGNGHLSKGITPNSLVKSF